MSISAGTRLGPYEVLEPLGAGGMGEVYRARDPRLEREVAIKVLPAEFSEDSSRLKRFEKEARSASALNHPNIVTIYDIGSQDGLSYIAMEKVEGSSLRELLVPGAMASRRLFPMATQIAEGLAKAHEAGIVHRDLKPENVMVTKDGIVKILDFGLAKLTGPLSGSGEGSHLPTMTGTSPGVVVGTVGYMSPEQASGSVVGLQSDQFSFGSILYEMATGKRAFQRKTGVDTLAAILNDDPEAIASVNPQVPAALRWIVERCLAKDPNGRYESTKDLARELATVRDHLPEASSSAFASVTRSSRRSWPWIVAATLTVAGLAFAAYIVGGRRADSPPPFYQQLTFRRGGVYSARFAPDGESIVYTAAWDGRPPEIFVGSTRSVDARPFGLDGAKALAVSSSGELAVSLKPVKPSAPRTLARVPIGGGVAPREILEGVEYADWAPDGKSLAVIREGRLEYPPGKVLYEATDGWLSGARISPDGNRVAFFDHIATGDDSSTIILADRNGSTTKIPRSFISASGMAWSPGGELWFTATESAGSSTGVNGRSLYRLDRNGRIRLLARIPGSLTLQDISRTGRVLVTRDITRDEVWVLAPGEPRERDLTWLDANGAPSLSLDGKMVLLTGPPREFGIPPGPAGEPFNYYHVYLRKTDGSLPVLLGQGQGLGLSPDARWAVAVPQFTHPSFVAYPTGAGEPRNFPIDGLTLFNAGPFIDNEQFLFTANEKGHELRVYVQNLSGGKPRPLTPEGFHGRQRITGDLKWTLVGGPEDKMYLYPTGGGEPREIIGLQPGDRIAGLGSDEAFIYIRKGRGLPARIVRHDLKSGRQESWRDITPADTAGIEDIGVIPSPSGEAYAYACSRVLSDLYVVDGLH